MRGDDGYLPAKILQATGLVLLIAFTVFWAFTGRESVLLVGAAASLILLGRYGSAEDSLRRIAQPRVTVASEEERRTD